MLSWFLLQVYIDGNHHISSSSDSDEEELPHSQRGQKQTQVFTQNRQIVEFQFAKKEHTWVFFFPLSCFQFFTMPCKGAISQYLHAHLMFNFTQCQVKGLAPEIKKAISTSTARYLNAVTLLLVVEIFAWMSESLQNDPFEEVMLL